MSVKLEAPYPALQTTSVLPNPTFNDSEALTDSVSEQKSMSGILYTYVKTTGARRLLLLQFELNRMKALELRAFIKAYYQSQIQLTDHNAVVWVGYLTSNPFEFDTQSRDDRQVIQLEFQGVSQ